MTCISSSRDNQLIAEKRERIQEFGESLTAFINATPEERFYQIVDIRRQTRELGFLVNDPESGCQKLIQEAISANEISFLLEKQNIDSELIFLQYRYYVIHAIL